MPVIGDHWIDKAFFFFIFYCLDIQEEIRKFTRGRNSCTSTSGGPFRASDVIVRQGTDWPPVLPATLVLNQWNQDKSAYTKTVSLFRFQSELCSIDTGAWNIMLLIPYEEHSQHEKGSGKHGYAGRKLRSILWKISPQEQEGICQKVLSLYYREIWDSKDPKVSKF